MPEHRSRPPWLAPEPRVLLLIAAAAALVLLFGKIAEDVIEHESGAFDRTIMLALRVPGDLAQPIGPHWLEEAFVNITSLGSPTIIALVTFVAVAYLVTAARPRLALVVALSIISGSIVEHLMKLGFDRPRPEIVPHLVTVTSLSFPSGHAMLSAVTYLSIGALVAKAQKRARLRAFVLTVGVAATLLIGISRVYLGVHYPTDVLAGWCAGALWALLFWLIARRVTR